MGRQARIIFKNSSFIFAGNIIKKALSFVLTIIVARYLGVDSFGILSFALSFVALFSIITDFGAQTLINREISRNKSLVNKFVSNVFFIKSLLSFVFFGLLIVLSLVLDYNKVFVFIMLAGLIQLFQSFDKPLGSAFRAFEKMHLEAVSIVVQSVLKLLLALVVIHFNLGLLFLLIAYVISSFVEFLLRIILYNFMISRFSFEVDFSFAKRLFFRSIPFGVAALFMTFYDKIDVFMMSKLVANPDAVIGGYSAAYGLLWAFEFIPISFGGAVYPYLSRLYLSSKEKFFDIIRVIIKYYYYITFPIAFGTTIIAREVMLLFFGSDYLFAASALQILIWSVIFKFQMYSMGIALNSMNLEKVTMRATIISLLTNVVLNAFLIPLISFNGASISTVFSEMVYFFYGSFYLKKEMRLNNLVLLWKPLLSSVLMAFIVYVVNNNFGLWRGVFSGVVSYLFFMFLLRAFRGSDINEFLSVLKKSS